MSKEPSPFEALQSALAVAGSQTALAEICGVSQTAVWKWLQSSKRIPAEYVLKAEQATGISCHDLRPDIYPRERMVDHRAGLHPCPATGQIGFIPHHGDQHSDRFLSVDFDRGSRMKGAAR